MQLLQGETLEERLDRVGGRLPADEVMRIGREVAEGLAAAHARGLVHRDIKPANVWLEAGRDRVKLLDFGLARGTGEDARLTQAGAVVGTPSYMAPEQANGEEVDGRCDLFGLGAVLYRACTGELPFDGKDTLSVLQALATKTPRPPHRIVPSVPRVFSDLVTRMLEKDRDDRPQSAHEVIEAIEEIERGESAVPAAEAAPPYPTEESPPARRQPKEQDAPPPEPPAETPRASRAAGSGVKRKGPRRARPSGRRKKRHEAEGDLGRRVLVASLVLLGVGLLVLVLGIIRYAVRTRRTAWGGPTPIQTVSTRRSERGAPVRHRGTWIVPAQAYPVER
jgi:serine/threonine protein kinase